MNQEHHWEALTQKHMDQCLEEGEREALDNSLATQPQAAEAFARAALMDHQLEAIYREDREQRNVDLLLGITPKKLQLPLPEERWDENNMPVSSGPSYFAMAMAAAFILAVGLFVYRLNYSQPPLVEGTLVEQIVLAPVIGKVQTSGSVEIHRGDTSFSAKPEDVLREGDLLILGQDASATLIYRNEKTWMKMAPGTQARFHRVSEGKRVDLLNGVLTCEADPQQSPFILTTTHARAEVLGTLFSLSASQRLTRLEVTRGKVTLSDLNTGNSLKTTAGFYSQVGLGLGLEMGSLVEPAPEPQPEPEPEPEPEPPPTAIAGPDSALPGLYFVELKLAPAEQGLQVTTQPVKTLPLNMVNNRNYFYDRLFLEETYDAAFRRVAKTLLFINSQRDQLIVEKIPAQKLEFPDVDLWEPLELFTIDLRFALRNLKGDIIEKQDRTLKVGLAREAGFLSISADKEEPLIIKIQTLAQEENYKNFLQTLIMPAAGLTFKKPDDGQWLADLYYREFKPNYIGKARKFNVKYFPIKPITYSTSKVKVHSRGELKPYIFHLGTTWLEISESGIKQHASDYFHFLKKAIQDNRDAVGSNLEPEKAIPLYEKYLARVPSDRIASLHLLNLYLKQNQVQKADAMIASHQPFFVTTMGTLRRSRLSVDLPVLEKQRSELLENRATFSLDPEVRLNILQPQTGELVAGKTPISFVVKGEKAPLLRVDVLVNDELTLSLEEPPFKVYFTPDRSMKKAEVKVIAWFGNRTYGESVVNLDVLQVDETAAAHLVELQLVADGSRISDLDISDIVIMENGQPQETNAFAPVREQLQLAILIDGSISMSGDSLYHAQYALNQLLDRLGPNDTAAIYAFNDKVMRLMPFTRDFSKYRSLLHTLSPQMTTTLHDALLIAQNDMNAMDKGIKAMVVLSDGHDNGSATAREQIIARIERSPIRVYGIEIQSTAIPNVSRSRRHSSFLEELAASSGSFARTVKKTRKLDKIFQEIHRELASLYYVNYYSPVKFRDNREVKIQSGQRGVSLRWMTVN